MTRLTVPATALAALVATSAAAAPVFFIEPSGGQGGPDLFSPPNPDLDLPFRNSFPGGVFEEGFEGFATGPNVSGFQAGPITVDITLENEAGASDAVATVLGGSFPDGLSSSQGGRSILNVGRNYSVRDARPFMIFDFSAPVYGFGAWILDDNFDSTFTLRVTDIDGNETTSPLLDHGPPAVVEGFMGVSSTIGLTSVVIEDRDSDGEIFPQDFFWVDTVQVATTAPVSMPAVPLPAGLPLMVAGVGALALLRRRG